MSIQSTAGPTGQRRLRLTYADKVTTALAYKKHDSDHDGFRRQTELAFDGAAAFVKLIDYLLPIYVRRRKLAFVVSAE